MGNYLDAMVQTTSNMCPIPFCPVTKPVGATPINQNFLLRPWYIGSLTFEVVSVGSRGW